MYRGKWEYDVFVCFRGSDTRNGFTSHLMDALSDKQIKAFIDDKLQKAECIDELISILHRSALSIVIFSENFADSTWCLEEVVAIAQRVEEFGHRVLPVFYKVDPSDITEDSGSYAAAVEQKHGATSSPEDRKRWKNGLKAVANCAGHTSQAIKIDSELVKAIVKDVLEILTDMSPRVKSDILIGMDARVSEVEKLLAVNVDDFRIIGLWGMGGVGKSTLAKACYQSFVCSGKEIKHHFVHNINEKCGKQSGIEGMVQELYSILLAEDNLNYQNLEICYRRDRLSRLRVFLVLDSVETVSQLEQLLLGDVLNTANLFAQGSRIILTARNRRVLEYAGAYVYHVKCLHSHESLQLFMIHAFRKGLPPIDWTDLLDAAVSYCKGSPLAIKVLGGALFCRDKSYWKSLLNELGKIPTPEIHDVLRRSYDELGIVEKRVFLDIACFFGRWDKFLLITFCPTSSQIDHVVEDLIDKSLFIRISGEGYEDVEVHDLLREMAWSIVNEEPKLEIRSRLKNCDDIHKLLRVREVKSWKTYLLNIFQGKEMPRSTFEGGRVTECISLDLSETNEMHLEANAFEGMSSLRYLCFFYSREGYGVCKVHVPYLGLDTLPDSLMWLQWDGFPSKSLPSRFSPENLVSLTIRHSTMMQRCWEVQPKLGSVVRLDLSHCINLTEAPDLSRSPSLVYLVLKGCRSLIELPSHVQDLEKLTTLDVSGCTILRRLPAKLNSKFLKYVYLSNCPKITRCPEINSRELKMLDLRKTVVEAWPGAIYQIKEGGTLRLCGKHILSFPAISANLKEFRLCHTTIREMDCYDDDHPQGSLPRFVRLELVDNPQLKSLSRNIWKMVSQSLILHYCPSIDSLPEMSHPVTGLTHLSIKGCRKLKSFPTGINNMKSLRTFCFCNTDIKTLPACVEELDQLSSLDLSSNYSLESVPCNIHKLAKLSSLLLTGCRRIQSLPDLPLNLLILDVSGCKSLQALPSNVGRLRWKRLYFEDCPQLDTSLPKEVVHNFHHHAVSNLHPQGVLQYSGSEIPEWFPCKSMNQKNDSCMMVQLPPSNCTIKGPVKGIAFGVVCSSNIRNTWMRFHCKCNIDTTVAARWISRGFGMAPSQSDNAYIWYDKSLFGWSEKGIREEEEPWYQRYAGRTVSFRFCLAVERERDLENLKGIKIKRVGVCLLY